MAITKQQYLADKIYKVNGVKNLAEFVDFIVLCIGYPIKPKKLEFILNEGLVHFTKANLDDLVVDIQDDFDFEEGLPSLSDIEDKINDRIFDYGYEGDSALNNCCGVAESSANSG